MNNKVLEPMRDRPQLVSRDIQDGGYCGAIFKWCVSVSCFDKKIHKL